MVFCYEKLNDLEKLVNFLSQLLIEKEFFNKTELSYSYYKLGCALLQLNRITQAREIFWKLKRLSPSFPGLKEKLEDLERRKIRSKSRYELLINQKIITEEQIKQAREIARKEGIDIDERLIKTLCNECKEPYKPTSDEIEELREEFGKDMWDKWVNIDKITLYRAKGCSHCMQGYKGRMGIHELLKNSDGLKSLIKKRAPTDEIKKLAIEEGMLTLKQDGILKVLQGYTDIHQVRAVAGKR